MALCTSVSSPLSFSSFHHLLSSSLTDPLIIGPQNKAEILESEKPSLLSMPLEDDISVSHRFIYAQTGELHALMFPLIILLFTLLFWFDISKFPTHHLPITGIHWACVLHSPRWKVVVEEEEEEEEEKRENWGWWVKRNTGWVHAWGWWLWWNVKWCCEGCFCSLSHQ